MVVKGITMNLVARIAIFVTTIHEPSSLHAMQWAMLVYVCVVWPDTGSHGALTI